jgi:hypothetical protein
MSDVNPAGGTPATGGTPENVEGTVPFEGWLSSQDETAKGLIDAHVRGLKSALDSERAQRSELQKALKEATKGLEAESDAKKRLDEIASQMVQYEQQAAFYETASAAGATNLKLAWLAAREAGAIGRDGVVNIAQLQTAYPELFKQQQKPPVPGSAGAGMQSPPSAGSTSPIDDLIRRKAGIQ